MIIALMRWKCFGIDDIKEAFLKLGHKVIEIPFDDKKEANDKEAIEAFQKEIKEKEIDIVFSFNFFPVISIGCKNLGISYISWIYDSPYVRIYHYSVAFPTNHIFVFDSSIFLEFHQAGIKTVHYLPMAANVERIEKMTDFISFNNTEWRNEKPVAFVGSLYTEKHNFYQRMNKIDEYTKGYLDGLMNAQKNIFGYNFIQETLKNNQKLLQVMQEALPMQAGNDNIAGTEYLFAQYVVNRQITAIERREYLTEVADKYGLDLYTPDKQLSIQGCLNHGPVDYYDMAPYVFKKAPINLNISLRSIISGIPLRCFDIMAAGGFLITNYQSDFFEYFTPNEDFVYYESKEDLLGKIGYYLKNEDERKEIAENGMKKIGDKHTYQHRVKEMLSYLK